MKALFHVLGPVAVLLFTLSVAGTASATPFGGDNDQLPTRLCELPGFTGLFQFSGPSVSFSSVGSSGHRGIGFGRFDFVWTTDPGEAHASDHRSDRAQEFLLNLRKLTHRLHNHHFTKIDFRPIRPHKPPGNGPAPAIPEPSAALIFAAGLAVAGWRRRS